jgi:[lysine-biosynthesis-protein LysW]--L-2-aminoadipate ligase
MTTIGIMHTTIRGDEKLLMEAAKKRKLNTLVFDVRKQIYNPITWEGKLDVVLERCISTMMGMHTIRFFDMLGIPTVNTLTIAQLCDDKFATSLRLLRDNVPTVPFTMAFSEEQAKKAIVQLGGYPVVLKPSSGSWGRLLAKINDDDALEAVLEQKSVLGSPSHKAFYIQKFIHKPERDIRVTVVDHEPVCAIYRETKHWISNTARGAVAKNCPIDNDLRKISIDTSKSIGGGVLGIDIFETGAGYVVNEVNYTAEFKNVQRVTKTDVAGVIIDYCRKVAASNAVGTQNG